MDISKSRQRILQLYKDLEEVLTNLISCKPFLKGSIYELKRRCGKPNCKCATQGKLHPIQVWTKTEKNRHYLKVIKIWEKEKIIRLIVNRRNFLKQKRKVKEIFNELQNYIKIIERRQTKTWI